MTRGADDAALVLFSGGQDSTTCLAWALARFSRVETLGFDYGQRHKVELACRDTLRAALARDFPAWSGRLGPDHLLNLGALGEVADTALTAEREIAIADNGLPTTFVPGRNLIFLAFAGALAYRRDIRHLALGVCETDYSGYPDCRDDTVKAMQVALNLGMESRLIVHTPLMWIDKAATWDLAAELGGAALVELIRAETHTCYLGERAIHHPWGVGCGHCPACDLRAQGYARHLASRA